MKFKILNSSGDQPLDYDLETAELKFKELTDQGLLPLAVTKDGNVPVRVFDPGIEELIFVPAVVGG